jgi:glutamate dehydrogenase (NAD(P)+)
MKEDLLNDPVFGMAAGQFDRVADFLKLDERVRERCKWPKRIITVSLPVTMDNGHTEVFYGYRVQHHLSRGPVKGGLRFHPKVKLGEVAALAMWMNWKCALMGLPYGGGKGGIACDPSKMSMGEQERLTRRFAQEIAPFIGPEIDVMAPDVGTTAQHMAWILDTYSTREGRFVPEVVTGKPLELQGSEGRTQATGHGVAFLASRALNKLEIPVKGDITGAIWNRDGISIFALKAHVAETGGVADFAKADAIDPDEMLLQECHVLVPAALERIITDKNAGQLRCRILAEGANGPTTQSADAIIEERGDIFLLPDILCNAGGVTVSYFEWVQNLQRFSWTKAEVLSKLETKLNEAFETLLSFCTKHKCAHRLGALATGVDVVAKVKMTRGLFP